MGGGGGLGGGDGPATPVTWKATRSSPSSPAQWRAHAMPPVSAPGHSYSVACDSKSAGIPASVATCLKKAVAWPA